MKKLLVLTLALSLLLPLCACNFPETEPVTGVPPLNATVTVEDTETATDDEVPLTDDTTVRLMAMTGPTGMGLASLLHNDKEGEGNLADYEAELVTAPDQVVPAIANGTCDIAAVPINLASTLYAKTKGQVQVLCANTLGVLHIVENGDTIMSAKDLKGKTIYAPNPGSTPEYILRFVLKENGIDPDNDVTLQFFGSGDEVASQLAANPEAVGMLPEPKVSAFLSANATYRAALDMTEEWNQVAGKENNLIQGVFIARKAFIQEHPAVVEAFLKDYDASQALVNGDLEKGAQLVVEAGIIPKAPLAKKAIPGCNITFLEGAEMKKGVAKCLDVLFEAAPQSVGNAIPGDDFYFTK